MGSAERWSYGLLSSVGTLPQLLEFLCPVIGQGLQCRVARGQGPCLVLQRRHGHVVRGEPPLGMYVGLFAVLSSRLR
jgi:hypothetical protein